MGYWKFEKFSCKKTTKKQEVINLEITIIIVIMILMNSPYVGQAHKRSVTANMPSGMDADYSIIITVFLAKWKGLGFRGSPSKDLS